MSLVVTGVEPRTRRLKNNPGRQYNWAPLWGPNIYQIYIMKHIKRIAKKITVDPNIINENDDIETIDLDPKSGIELTIKIRSDTHKYLENLAKKEAKSIEEIAGRLLNWKVQEVVHSYESRPPRR